MSDSGSHTAADGSVQVHTAGSSSPTVEGGAAATPVANATPLLTVATPALLRIPGCSDDGVPPQQVQIGERLFSIPQLVVSLSSPTPRSRSAAAQLLAAREGLNRTELHLVTTALFRASHDPGEFGGLAREALYKVLLAHAASLEAIYLGLQILKRWERAPHFEAAAHTLLPLVTSALQGLRCTGSLTRKQHTEHRYVLIKALEVESVRSAACVPLRLLLLDDSAQGVQDRKELAGNILFAVRGLNITTPGLSELKRLASAVVATGRAVAPGTKATPVDIDRSTICITALQAEMRRQYGLASTLEVVKAAKLLGRSIRIHEYERAVTFSATPSADAPSNTSWLSLDEWKTVARLFQLALKDPDLSTVEGVTLLYLLVTRIKAEDHADPRDSRRRVDMVENSERRDLLNEVKALCTRCDRTLEQIEEAADAVAARILVAPFDSWRSECAPELRRGGAASATPSAVQNERAAEVVTRLLRDDTGSTAMRLAPEDLHLLRQVEGLGVDDFRTVTQRLTVRAISDPWARTTILDLARLPHAPEVNARVRTAVLGALVSEARRLGRLTHQLEKEVFAVSAEIPSLPFLSTATSAEPESYEDFPEISDQDEF